ncbi:MAG: polyphenol oxidase family protein [Deltaproteobacteria bacterium]|nr:polyphenol oxidase family protein [Deltaproteobacteria bacterium]
MDHTPRIPERRDGRNPLDVFASSELLGRVPGLLHGFTLRAAGDFAHPEDRVRLEEELAGARRLRLLRQVHGVAVAGPDDPEAEPEGDAWAGRPPPGVLLGVRTADCLPVLFCHPASRTLGLAHAGWRGAVGGIAAATLKAMGVRADEVLVALGPSIGPCCYEVGADVAEAVGCDSPSLRPEGSRKFRFDLPGFVADQLLAVGVAASNLEHVNLCTACRPDLLFSYRREGRTGRLCAFLGWSEAL